MAIHVSESETKLVQTIVLAAADVPIDIQTRAVGAFFVVSAGAGGTGTVTAKLLVERLYPTPIWTPLATLGNLTANATAVFHVHPTAPTAGGSITGSFASALPWRFRFLIDYATAGTGTWPLAVTMIPLNG